MINFLHFLYSFQCGCLQHLILICLVKYYYKIYNFINSEVWPGVSRTECQDHRQRESCDQSCLQCKSRWPLSPLTHCDHPSHLSLLLDLLAGDQNNLDNHQQLIEVIHMDKQDLMIPRLHSTLSVPSSTSRPPGLQYCHLMLESWGHWLDTGPDDWAALDTHDHDHDDEQLMLTLFLLPQSQDREWSTDSWCSEAQISRRMISCRSSCLHHSHPRHSKLPAAACCTWWSWCWWRSRSPRHSRCDTLRDQGSSHSHHSPVSPHHEPGPMHQRTPAKPRTRAPDTQCSPGRGNKEIHSLDQAYKILKKARSFGVSNIPGGSIFEQFRIKNCVVRASVWLMCGAPPVELHCSWSLQRQLGAARHVLRAPGSNKWWPQRTLTTDCWSRIFPLAIGWGKQNDI